MVNYVCTLIFSLLIPLSMSLYAELLPIENGPIHEALATQINANLVLEAVSSAPPKNITERIPAQEISDAQWIPGYWAWSKERKDYIWISGVWRIPPPGQQWIAGYWEKFEDGWVWLNGFWNDKPLDQVDFIKEALPAAPEEAPAESPGRQFFWSPGYWDYDITGKNFDWVAGEWQPLDPNWVLVPAHYEWRPDGYIFIEAFWDWPLELRGQLFASMAINAMEGVDLVFQPFVKVPFQQVIDILLPCYPNYLCLFYHHYCYHPDFWEGYWGTPPWWGWQNWWCIGWEQQWGVWWWYCHPGYPQPYWMTSEIASLIPPPAPQLLQWVEPAVPPVIVTPKGVVKISQIQNALKYLPGKNTLPIIPANKAVKDKFFENLAKQPAKPVQILKPKGTSIVKIPPAAVLNPIKGEKVPKPVKTMNLPKIPKIALPPSPVTQPVSPIIEKPARPPIRKIYPNQPVDTIDNSLTPSPAIVPHDLPKPQKPARPLPPRPAIDVDRNNWPINPQQNNTVTPYPQQVPQDWPTPAKPARPLPPRPAIDVDRNNWPINPQQNNAVTPYPQQIPQDWSTPARPMFPQGDKNQGNWPIQALPVDRPDPQPVNSPADSQSNIQQLQNLRQSLKNEKHGDK